MRKNKLFSFLFAALLSSPLMAAPNVTVTVRAETVGQETVYHYVMTRSGPEDIRELSIGVRPSGYKCRTEGVNSVCAGNYFGTIMTMPTGTTWAPDPYFNLTSQTPTLSATATTQPPQWTAKAWGLRSLDGAVSEAPGGVRFIRTLGQFEGPLDPSSYVQQPTYRFSVRVPSGPTTAAEYMNGLFAVDYLYQGHQQTYHAAITAAPPPIPPSMPSAIFVPATVNAQESYNVLWEQRAITPGALAPTYWVLRESPSPVFEGCTACRPGRQCAAICTPSAADVYSGAGTQIHLPGKPSGGTWWYRVKACSPDGCSLYLPSRNGIVIK